jgi:hypothetical protein
MPNYHLPDMIGFIFIIYIAPYTLLLSTIDAVFIAIVFAVINKRNLNQTTIKLIMSAPLLLISFVATELIEYNHVFDYSDKYLLPACYAISLIAALWLHKIGFPKTTACEPISMNK